MPETAASVLAAVVPMTRLLGMPGPWVTAMPSTSPSDTSATRSASAMATGTLAWCPRAAISGWMPLVAEWSWRIVTLERTSRVAETTAAHESSHEL